ncbi:MAG: glycosyltransferase [Pedobacter sp.]|nr:MAG: glycosyltransferase [Pedobacter sp.]
MSKSFSVIIPVFNEETNLGLMVEAIKNVAGPLPYDYNIIFVDDGSSDNSLIAIKSLAARFPEVNYISFSRNFGHQNAIKAGFDVSRADAVISMDGDMQHPPAMLPQLLDLWEQGNDIVYTIRRDHAELPKMKKKTSDLFYSVLRRLSSVELEKGTADFRLLDKKVVDVLREIKEYDLFWRGLVKWLGFKQVSVEYDPAPRASGHSKYNFKKMLELALKGITSFSTKPLTIAIYLGFVCSLISFFYFPYAIISYYTGHVISGWASVIVTIAFFGGIQLMIMGIIGLYLGKLFMQSKQRPHYIIAESNLE